MSSVHAGRTAKGKHDAPRPQPRKRRLQAAEHPARIGRDAATDEATPLTASPLSLERLGLGGAALKGPTHYRSNTQSQLNEEMLVTLAQLMDVGVISPLPPLAGEPLKDYFRRLSQSPVEGIGEDEYSLFLVPYEMNQHSFDNASSAVPGELVIVGEGTRARASNCTKFKARCRPLHPRFFGSLMVHLSEITENVWPVLTARDGLKISRYMRFDCEFYDDSTNFGSFWEELTDELRGKGLKGTREEIRQKIEDDDLVPPRELFKEIGIDEVLPALKEKLCFSLEKLLELSAGEPEIHQLVLDLQSLKKLNDKLDNSESNVEANTKYLEGSIRSSPVAILSGQKMRRKSHYVHFVQAMLEEEWQCVSGNSGWYNNFHIHITSKADAARAKVRLTDYYESYQLTMSVVERLSDQKEE